MRDETKAHHLRDLGFEPTTGDLGDPRTLGPALEGVERAYLVSPIGPMQSEFEQAFLETREGGRRQARRQASVIGASPEAPLRFARTHAKVEAALKESGMAWTLLRPTGFMQNTLAGARACWTATSTRRVPDAAFSIVDARDVAEVAAVALTEEGHEGKAYGLSGPEAVSYRDQATRVFAAAGREIEVEEIPVETLKRELVRAGVPPWNAEGLASCSSSTPAAARRWSRPASRTRSTAIRAHRRLRRGPRGRVQGAA